MKPTPKSATSRQPRAPRNGRPEASDSKPMDVEPSVEPSSGDGLQWPPVEVPKRKRAHQRIITFYRGLAKPEATVAANAVPGPHSSAAPGPLRPVPSSLSEWPSRHLVGVARALGVHGPRNPVETPAGTPVTKIPSVDCSPFTAVGTASGTQRAEGLSEDFPVEAEVEAASALLMLRDRAAAEVHPVLGIRVPTSRRS